MPAINDPVLAYQCPSNIQAHLFAAQLKDAEISAHVVDDLSFQGADSDRASSDLFKAKIYVEKGQLEEAVALIKKLEAIAQKKHDKQFCFHCGMESTSETICSECGNDLTIGSEYENDEQQAEPIKVGWLIQLFAFIIVAILLYNIFIRPA